VGIHRTSPRNPFNPPYLISHLTNSNGCGNLRPKVPLTVSPFRRSLQQQLGAYSRPFNSCHPARTHKSRCFILLQTLCRRQKTQPLCNQANPNSFLRNTRGRGTSARSQRSLRLTLSPRRVHPACPSFEASLEGRVIISLCFCRPITPRCLGSELIHSPADPCVLYLPLESTLPKVFQNK
jgi:hypothetical protein